MTFGEELAEKSIQAFKKLFFFSRSPLRFQIESDVLTRLLGIIIIYLLQFKNAREDLAYILYIYNCIAIHIIHISFSLNSLLNCSIYIHMHIHTCTYMNIYMYIHMVYNPSKYIILIYDNASYIWNLYLCLFLYHL